ncbi:hypothetical protein [Nonomuraea sp. NPDC049504]|uniref:hypothetical protein n=1 Tax=Nonomuraea sp. NPDC049504 TaxID=3154729 RepID=UPI003419EB78
MDEIGQLAGWMAFDATRHGLAQRYFITALRAAHQVNGLPLYAHILADLSIQAASRDHPADAITLGEAARRASGSASPAVRASVLSPLGFAYAAAGRAADFMRTRDRARELVETPATGTNLVGCTSSPPNHLDCQAGYALIHPVRLCRTMASLPGARTFLAQGISGSRVACLLPGSTTSAAHPVAALARC